MIRYSPVNGGRAGPCLFSYQLDASHLATYHDSQRFQAMNNGQLSPEARSLVEAVVETILSAQANDRLRTGIRILGPAEECPNFITLSSGCTRCKDHRTHCDHLVTFPSLPRLVDGLPNPGRLV